MNEKICDIVTEMVREGVEIPVYLHKLLSQVGPAALDREVVADLFKARRVMLQVILRIARPNQSVYNELAFAAEVYWESQRHQFIWDAHNLISTGPVRELFARVHADGVENPKASFLAGLDHHIKDTLGEFVYDYLSRNRS